MNPFKKLLDLIFPKRCIFCNTPVYSGQPYCEQCISLIPFAREICPVCGKNPCICGRKQLAFSGVSAVFFYELGAENAIRQLKFHERVSYAAPLANYLYYKLLQCDFYPEVDVIIPVPMSKKAEHERGYNQSVLLAKGLAKKSGIPVCTEVLIKMKDTKKQHDLGQRERQENLKGAFQVFNPHLVAGKTVLLCDDVYTTGATFDECARTLLAFGAAKVFCIAVATTRKTNLS